MPNDAFTLRSSALYGGEVIVRSSLNASGELLQLAAQPLPCVANRFPRPACTPSVTGDTLADPDLVKNSTLKCLGACQT